jgi:hypothetical protein
MVFSRIMGIVVSPGTTIFELAIAIGESAGTVATLAAGLAGCAGAAGGGATGLAGSAGASGGGGVAGPTGPPGVWAKPEMANASIKIERVIAFMMRLLSTALWLIADRM